jgi:DNA-directed RNA polymerase delta subunit
MDSELALNSSGQVSASESVFLPRAYRQGSTFAEFFRLLPELFKEILLSNRRANEESTNRLWIVIQRRYGISGVKRMTLEEIGQAFNVSRQRIEQLEKKALRSLKTAFEVGCINKYYLHPEVIGYLNDIFKLFPIDQNDIVTESVLYERISKKIVIPLDHIRPSLHLLLYIKDVGLIDFDNEDLEPIFGKFTTNTKRSIKYQVNRLHTLMTKIEPEPLDEIDILSKFNSDLPKTQRINLAQLKLIIPLCSTLERLTNGKIQGRLEYLSSQTNQAYRVLYETGIPLHYSELAREINHRCVHINRRNVYERTLVNYLTIDERLVPQGKSGFWGLKSWDINTSTIVELMEKCLVQKNSPASEEEIYEYVLTRRQVSRASIKMYLNQNDKFLKIDRDTWGLKSWPEAQRAQSWNRQQVANFVAELYRERRTREMEYRVIENALADAAKVSKRTARGMLITNPVIKSYRKPGSSLTISVFQTDYKKELETPRVFERKKPTLRDTIESAIISEIQSAPSQEILLSTLVKRLIKKYGWLDKTIYQYLTDMDEVEKIQLPHLDSKICRLKTASTTFQFPKLENITNPSLRNTLTRAVSFLNEDDVDIGLFLIGKQFEVVLKQYLLAASSRNVLKTLPGREPDKWTLNSMIECVRANNTVTDATLLQILRIERNDRAHGENPSLEEKRRLLRGAKLIVDVYFDHIAFFSKLAGEMEGQL